MEVMWVNSGGHCAYNKFVSQMKNSELRKPILEEGCKLQANLPIFGSKVDITLIILIKKQIYPSV